MSNEETFDCPECHQAMHKTYIRTKQSNKKYSWKLMSGTRYYPAFNIEKLDPKTRQLV
jgi:hypothetical protein